MRLSGQSIRGVVRLAMIISAVAAAGCTARDDSQAPAGAEAIPTAPPVTDPVDKSPFAIEDGFAILGLSDFDFHYGKGPGKESTWTGAGTTIHTTGKPRGYAYSKESYRNFTLRLDFRFVPPEGPREDAKLQASNTGVLVYITGQHKLWPVSLEVQGKHVEMASIKANGGAATAEIEDDEKARQQARKDVGQWNSLEIVSRDGALTSFLNGTKICESRPGELKEGPIGLQAEDYAVEFRNVRIRRE